MTARFTIVCEFLTSTETSMISKRNLSILAAALFFTLHLVACSKRNTELETDYAAKKASAETLINQINTSMTSMKNDHDQWMASLTTASAKAGADTAKISALKGDIAKHEADADSINVLIDSTKAYMNATPDQGDAFKNADDHLGTNFNDLSDRWKSFQDTHNSLQQQVQQLAVTTAGSAADTAQARVEKKQAAKPAMKHEAPKPAVHTHPGIKRSSAH